VTWLAAVDEDQVFLSVVTLAELRHGIERLPHGNKRTRLDEWVRHDLLLRFEGRILPIDSRVADAWGGIVARAEAAGRPMSVMDALVAATAEVHGVILVTRNGADFETVLQGIINPWH
jgi:predicted nucleic acid-binding protein